MSRVRSPHRQFACEAGTTPTRLLKAGIYDSIATPLKGGPWRQASMVMVTLGVAEDHKLPEMAEMAELPDGAADRLQIV